MNDEFSFVYEIITPDGAVIPFRNRVISFDVAKQIANDEDKPITIGIRVRGSKRKVCDLTIYPDWKEE